MYRIKDDTMAELEIKKSRFLCYLHKSFSEADAKDFIQKIKKLHPNARHHCYAFIIGEHNELQRSNDDGEPQGTAGVPMLECLVNRKMQDTIAVTVRYFGCLLYTSNHVMRKLLIIGRQLMCKFQQHRHMSVMSAGMHTALMTGSKRSSSSLSNRQCIHITAKCYTICPSRIKKSNHTAWNR